MNISSCSYTRAAHAGGGEDQLHAVLGQAGQELEKTAAGELVKSLRIFICVL